MQKMINNKNTINFFKKVKWQFSTTKKMRNSSKTKNEIIPKDLEVNNYV
jgi:hypothetical protein